MSSIIYQHSTENLQIWLNDSKTMAEFLRKLGLENKGNNYRTVEKVIKELNLDTSIFNLNRETFLKNLSYLNEFRHSRLTLENVLPLFTENSNSNTKRIRKNVVKFNLIPYFCKKCNNEGFWNEEKLTLQLEHINGINTDHRLENLCWLCPNCHSQTATYAGRNTKMGIDKRDKKNIKLEMKNKLIQKRLEQIKDVDLQEFGWVKKVADIWEISYQRVYSWFKTNCPEIPRFQRKKVLIKRI